MGQIWLWRDDGTRYRKKVYAKTRKNVLQKIRQLRKEQEHGISPNIKEETVKQYLLRWYQNPSLRPTSIDSRRVNIERIVPYIGGVKIRSLKPSQIQHVYDSLGERLSTSSVVQTHSLLRKALSDAVKEGTIIANPIDRVINTPKVERKEMASLKQNEVSTLLHLDNEWQPLWTVLIGTGMRLGEALGLQWQSVDLDLGSLVIRRTLQKITGRGLVYQNPKTDKSRRTIFLPDLVLKAFKRHRTRQFEKRLQVAADWINEDLVFPNEWGKPLEPTRVNRALKKSLHAVGIKHHIRVHDLRHTSASLALRRGIAGKVVQEMLGHSNYSTTMDIYSHVDPDMHKEASKQMNEALGG
jgi:integrase